MAAVDEVQRIYQELSSIEELLNLDSASPSDRVAFESHSVKTMLLAAASYFERRICKDIESYAQEILSVDHIPSFILKQGLERKFHTLFAWESTNANRFFSLFGPAFLKWIQEKAKDEEMDGPIKSFLYIGRERNSLVHTNYATYSIDNTYSEIWNKYEDAKKFVDWFPSKLRAYTTAE